MGAPKRADGRAVPQLGPPGEASGERELQEEAVGWDGGCEPRHFVGSRRAGGSAPRSKGGGQAPAPTAQAAESAGTLTAGNSWPTAQRTACRHRSVDRKTDHTGGPHNE